jgi:hypothetical protein
VRHAWGVNLPLRGRSRGFGERQFQPHHRSPPLPGRRVPEGVDPEKEATLGDDRGAGTEPSADPNPIRSRSCYFEWKLVPLLVLMARRRSGHIPPQLIVLVDLVLRQNRACLKVGSQVHATQFAL